MRKKVEKIKSIKFISHPDPFCPGVGADIFFFFGPLRNLGFTELPPRLGSNPLRRKVILMLETNEGEFSTAYEIICNLYKLYESVSLYVPTYCRGAGVLIAHAVDELILGEAAEVGRLDGFGKRLDIISSNAGRRAVEYLAGVDPNVGLIIDAEVRHLFDNVTEPTDSLKQVTRELVAQWASETWEVLDRAVADDINVRLRIR